MWKKARNPAEDKERRRAHVGSAPRPWEGRSTAACPSPWKQQGAERLLATLDVSVSCGRWRQRTSVPLLTPALSRCERRGERGEGRRKEAPQEPRNGSHVATTCTCVTDRGRFCISVVGSPLQRWHVSSHHQHTLPRAGLRTGCKFSRASLHWGLWICGGGGSHVPRMSV